MAVKSGAQATVKGVISGAIKNPKQTIMNNKGSLIAGVGHSVSIGVGTKHRINEGASLSGALASEFAQNALFRLNPKAMSLMYAAPMIYGGIDMAFQHRKQKGQDLLAFDNPSQRVGGGYMDTQRAHTMRQAAVQQIQGNKLNARSALGGEARIFSNRHVAG